MSEREREERRQEDEDKKRDPDAPSTPIANPHDPAVPGEKIQEVAHEHDPSEKGPEK